MIGPNIMRKRFGLKLLGDYSDVGSSQRRKSLNGRRDKPPATQECKIGIDLHATHRCE
jgi:hypothetical protein